MRGRYEVVFDDHGRERVWQVIAGSLAAAKVAAEAIRAARQMKLRRVRFVRQERSG